MHSLSALGVDADDSKSKADELLQQRMRQQSEEAEKEAQLTPEEIEKVRRLTLRASLCMLTDHQRTAEAEDWKNKGNKLYQEKDFGSAEIHYSSGIDMCA